jgi:undecaprenyl-diphosphatase
MIEAIINLDKDLFLFLNAWLSNKLFDIVFPVITERNFWIIPAIIASFIFYRTQGKKALVILAFAVVLVAITDPLCARILKPLFGRLRPCHPEMAVAGGRFLLGMKTSFSFPSNPAINIFAQAMLFTWFYRKQWPFFYTFACIIGFSRIYVGVHFPLDVFFGAIFGTAVALMLIVIYCRFLENKTRDFMA